MLFAALEVHAALHVKLSSFCALHHADRTVHCVEMCWVSAPKCIVQDTVQRQWQQAVQHEKQKGESEQRAAVSQHNLQLQQATQQLADARKATHTAQLEVDSLKG